MALEINQQAHAALLRTTGPRFPFAGVMVIMAANAVIVSGMVMTAQRRRRSARQTVRRVMADRPGTQAPRT
jgi:hypothetical protein